VLAAVVSTGGPILLASATMFIRDWVPASGKWSQVRRLSAYRTTTITYGLLAATVAWLGPIRSILDLMLFAFAMVVPPGIAVAYVLYWKRTTEVGVFWGMVLGYAGGLVWYSLTYWAGAAGLVAPTDAGLWHKLGHLLFVEGGGIDPSYPATLIPLVGIPLLSLLTAHETEAQESFHKAVGV
jgi:Na+/proline symporter